MKNIKCNIRDITYLLNSIKYTFIYEYTDFDDIEDFLIYDNDISHSNIPEDLLISLYHKYTHVSDSDYHINTEEHFHKCGIYLKLLLNGNYKESAVIEETVIVKTFTAELEHLLNKYDINNFA